VKITFLVSKNFKINYIGSEMFFLEIGKFGFQKIRIFTLISKMLIYPFFRKLCFGNNFLGVHFGTKVSLHF
jgi:ABC-type glucose/galactose transport system permease subunit